MQKTKSINLTLFLALLAICCGCGSSGTTSTGDTTHTLTFTLEEGAAAQIAKAYGTKAVDPSGWTVSCVSTDTSGTRTVKSGAWDATNAKFAVQEVPDSQDTVCYLAENGVSFSTLQYADTNAVGNRRDTSKVASDGSGKITYTTTTGSAVISDDSGIEAAAAENRTNLSTRWTIACSDVRNLISDEVDGSQACPSEFDNISIYPHLVMFTDASTELKTSYGAWASAEAYVTCGSTEGLDDLPTGWTLDAVINPTMGSAFSWSAPFENFTVSSASSDILDMVRTTSVAGLETFDTYKADATNSAFCTNTDDMCAAKYYEAVLRNYGRTNGASVCWPDLTFSFASNADVTASPWPDMGGSLTRPLSRYQFMESFQNGDETYMRGIESRITQVAGDSGSVDCNVRSETLVAIITPGGDPPSEIVTPGGDPTGIIPDPDVTTSVRFISNTLVQSVAGTDELSTLCQAQLGQSNQMTQNGFYSKGEMISGLQPIPSP